MNNIKEKLNNELLAAIRLKNLTAANVYRGVLALVQEKEARENKTYSNDDVLKIVEKEAQGYHETATGFSRRGDIAKAESEISKAALLEKLLPEKIEVDKYDGLVDDVIKELHASSIKDMGNVIKTLKDRFGMSLDFRQISAIVKQKLN